MRFIRSAFVTAAIASLALVGCAAPEEPSDEVVSFNLGFTASKEDDCDQGFQPACDWLSVTRR
ncbi:hypothetical protein [Streptomyces californicus]